MLTVALVVMVIFLFLRSLAATVIPSVAVPLSLVGTFGVMYLLGYSLEQPVADGADDLDRLRRRRRHRDDREHRALHRSRASRRCEAALEGLGADRLHDRVADRLADRGADPAAVHGRHRRPAVPRVRRHAERDDPGLGGRLADADADDVRQAAAAHARVGAGPASTAPPSGSSTASIARYGTTLRWVLRHQPATLLVAVGDAGRRRSSSTSSCPRASSRCRTPA